ncbi:hypothetical protein APTSU1_000130200 [Apodemus speciosus]|uniref:Prolactin receptor n=1 Tax=Apodemus speciosus TaxID=105296 RepID=A0ABQ0EGV0_APOSI
MTGYQIQKSAEEGNASCQESFTLPLLLTQINTPPVTPERDHCDHGVGERQEDEPLPLQDHDGHPLSNPKLAFQPIQDSTPSLCEIKNQSCT